MLETSTNGVLNGIKYNAESYHTYDEPIACDAHKLRSEQELVLGLFGSSLAGRMTLDVGTATGRYPHVFAVNGARAHGIDVEPEAIRIARAKCRRDMRYPVFEIGHASRLPYPSGSFDIITCMMGTLAHLLDAERRMFLGQARRCLAVHGHLVISTWNADFQNSTYLSFYSPLQRSILRARASTVTSLAEELRFAGFDCNYLGVCTTVADGELVFAVARAMESGP